jgi:hypothetical protein
VPQRRAAIGSTHTDHTFETTAFNYHGPVMRWHALQLQVRVAPGLWNRFVERGRWPCQQDIGCQSLTPLQPELPEDRNVPETVSFTGGLDRQLPLQSGLPMLATTGMQKSLSPWRPT